MNSVDCGAAQGIAGNACRAMADHGPDTGHTQQFDAAAWLISVTRLGDLNSPFCPGIQAVL